MDPEELESIPLDDGADLEAIPMDEGRPRRTRRVVLGETAIEAGGPTRMDTARDRVETGHVVDADAPIADVPETQKAPPSGPTAQQRDWWEDRETDRELSRTSAAGDTARTILGLLPGARGLSPDVAAAPGRLASRAQRAGEQWIETVGNEARPPDQSSGVDRRGEAMATGAADALSLGFADEMRGVLRSDPNPDSYRRERDRARAEMAETQQQAPSLFAAGEAVGTLPLLAAPNPATAGGRVLMGAAMGGLGAAGHSEADVGTSDFASDTALGAGLGAATSGAVEMAASPGVQRSAARFLGRRAEGMERFADQARVESAGLWGARADRGMAGAGGTAAMARDVRRFGIGQGGGQAIPRMEQAAGDFETLARGGGDTMGLIAQTADEAGARIPTQRVIDSAEAIARELETMPTATTQRAAERIRAEVAPLAGQPDMNASQAWRLRRRFDSLADFGSRAPDEAAMTAGEQFRALRRAVDRELDNAMTVAGLGTQWDEASRMAQVGIVGREYGRGGARLSTTGGVGGAAATGDTFSDALQSGSATQMLTAPFRALAGRAMSQETRMMAPGVMARGAEGTAAAMRTGERTLRGSARGLEQAPPAARRILDTMGRVGAARGGGEVGEGRSEARSSQDAGAWLSETLRTNPQALGAYAEHFADADPQEAARIHFQLSQSDPGYRAQIARARAEER